MTAANSSTPDKPSTPGKRRWFGFALAASLAVNVLLLGFVIGQAMHPGGRPFGPYMTMREASKALSPEGRDIVKGVLDTHSAEFRAKVKALKAEKRNLITLLTAKEFDELAVTESLAHIRDLNFALQTDIHATIIEIARALPAEERQKFNLKWDQGTKNIKRNSTWSSTHSRDKDASHPH